MDKGSIFTTSVLKNVGVVTAIFKINSGIREEVLRYLPHAISAGVPSGMSASDLLIRVLLAPMVEETIKSKAGLLSTVVYATLETAFVYPSNWMFRLGTTIPMHIMAYLIGQKKGLQWAMAIHISWNFFCMCFYLPAYFYFLYSAFLVMFYLFISKQECQNGYNN